jgi:hypothetical protein
VTAITLLEEVECRPVAKAYVDIIINDIKGGMRKTEFIPYKPAIGERNSIQFSDVMCAGGRNNQINLRRHMQRCPREEDGQAGDLC